MFETGCEIVFASVFGLSIISCFYFLYNTSIVKDLKYYYKNFRNGNLTLKMLYEYALLYIRHFSSYYLEVGYIEIQNNKFNLVFYSGSQKYRMVFPKKKRQISYVKNDNDEDISDNFFEYLGPGNNFYSIKTTPEMLSWNFPIIVGYRKGFEIEERKYNPTDIILTEL